MSYTILLETERLFLRRLTPDDAPLLHALDSDPEVMRYISKGQPTPLDKIIKTVLPRWLAYYETSGHLGYWAAHEQASGAFVGWFHLRPDLLIPIPTEGELGYRLVRHAWGQGYATEGGKALIEQAFTEWGIDRVVATTLLGNVASQRVMEKCGLQREGPFTYPESLLPGWTEDERRAVKYGVSRAVYLREQGR